MVTTCCVQQITRRDGDPEVFVTAARSLLQGKDIYLIPSQHARFYYYPPFFACLNIPLIFLPISLVIVLWALASIGLLGWSLTAFYSGMTGQPFFSLPSKTRWVVSFFSILLTARFIFLHLRFGQSNIFVLALVVLGLKCLTRRQRVRAGIAIALSIVVKLTTLPFGLWFLARLKGRVLLGMCLGGLLGVALPAYLYVVHLWYVVRLKDRIFRSLVVLSFVCATLTTNTIVGMFLSRLLASWGCISLGMILLSAAIFRAATCVRREGLDTDDASLACTPHTATRA